jgi:hypothetical protein
MLGKLRDQRVERLRGSDTTIALNLLALKPVEIDALICALDLCKPGLSRVAWELSHALDAEEGRRAKLGMPVHYGQRERPGGGS